MDNNEKVKKSNQRVKFKLKSKKKSGMEIITSNGDNQEFKYDKFSTVGLNDEENSVISDNNEYFRISEKERKIHELMKDNQELSSKLVQLKGDINEEISIFQQNINEYAAQTKEKDTKISILISTNKNILSKLNKLKDEINEKINNLNLYKNKNNFSKNNTENNISVNIYKNNVNYTGIDSLKKQIELCEKLIEKNKLNIDTLKKDNEKLDFLIHQTNEDMLQDRKKELEISNNYIYTLNKEIIELKKVKNEHEAVCKNKIKELKKSLELHKNENTFKLKAMIKNKSMTVENTREKLLKKNIEFTNEDFDNNMINEYKYCEKCEKSESNEDERKGVVLNNNNIRKKMYLKSGKGNNSNKKYSMLPLIKSNADQIWENFEKERNIKLLKIKDKSIHNYKKSNTESNTLFNDDEIDVLNKFIPIDTLNIYQDRYNRILEERDILEQKYNMKKQNKIFKEEKEEIIRNYEEKAEKIKKSNANLRLKLVKLNGKISEINEQLKKNKEVTKLNDYSMSKINQEYEQIIKKYKEFCNKIKLNKLKLKKTKLLTPKEMNNINIIGGLVLDSKYLDMDKQEININKNYGKGKNNKINEENIEEEEEEEGEEYEENEED